MTSQEQTLVDLARVLEAAEVPYMVIGGHANAVWGKPRATIDIDLTIWLAEDRIPELLERLAPGFTALVTDPVTFVGETRVLPLETAGGLRVDLIFGLLAFEQQAIRRAVAVEVEGEPVRFATAEDLILLKIVSTRERDRSDVRGIARRRRGRLDLDYLEPRIRELAALLERPEIVELWESASQP